MICAKGCFHGRTLAVISLSSDPDCRSKFGPFMPGIIQIDYNNPEKLKEVLEEHGKYVFFIFLFIYIYI